MGRPKKDRVNRKGELSQSDQFFIENHGEMSLDQLAKALEKPVDIIEAFCKDWIKKHKPGNRKGSELMDRPAKGVVSMTKGASAVGDDQYAKYVTVEAINRAMADKNFELAAQLKEKYDAQQKTADDQIKAKYSDIIHYIIKE